MIFATRTCQEFGLQGLCMMSHARVNGWQARIIFSAPQSGKPIADMASRKLSPYFRSFPDSAKGRYLEKLDMISI